MLTLCLQTWNLLVVVPCFTLLKIMKQWSRWSSKAGFQRWDTCPEPTELPWIGCSTGFIFIPRYTSNMLTPNTNLLTCSPKETSHVTSGITWFACSMVAISVQQAALQALSKRTLGRNGRRKSHGKVEADDELESSSASNRPETLRAFSRSLSLT